MRSPGGDWINVDASLVRVRGARQMALGAARSGCRTGFLGPLVKLLDRHGGNVLRSSRLVPANAKSRKWSGIVPLHFFTDAPSTVLLIHRRQQFAFTPLVPGSRDRKRVLSLGGSLDGFRELAQCLPDHGPALDFADVLAGLNISR